MFQSSLRTTTDGSTKLATSRGLTSAACCSSGWPSRVRENGDRPGAFGGGDGSGCQYRPAPPRHCGLVEPAAEYLDHLQRSTGPIAGRRKGEHPSVPVIDELD